MTEHTYTHTTSASAATQYVKHMVELGPEEKLEQELQNVNRILDLPLVVNVTIGTLEMTLSEMLKIMPGAILELEREVDVPLELRLSNKKVIAKGEVVTIGESIGLRVVEAEV